ncbi:hypothetical protein FZC84_16780 [Rossellomorea vietnamensis]|uniref:Uncharacterized protein n=1 Tax=Rossellomorea vietnamensis TaxID=218284 RepID=A0A5D4M963_9BACI|nr:hypothetical protein [Rossellomorea vietnamensis]TYR98038.1 hypothetical protein FZC84_16780 [Rossellomorea vietnamensis]
MKSHFKFHMNQFAEEVANERAAIRDRMDGVNPGSSFRELHRNSKADVIISGWGSKPHQQGWYRGASSSLMGRRAFFVVLEEPA